MSRIEQTIHAEREANKNYVLNEQLALSRHIEGSAINKGEHEKAWQISNAEALNRSRLLIGDLTREQIDR
jgi:hypothetical protein